MKTHTLKFKAALVAAFLALATQSAVYAEIPKRAVVAVLQDQEFNTWLAKQIAEDAALIPTLSEAQFLELMVNRIKHNAVEPIIEDVEGWIPATDAQGRIIGTVKNESNLIRLYERQLLIIKNLMLDPMEKRLQLAAANSDFYKIVENAAKVAKTMAYTKLDELTKMLKTHKGSPDWNKGKPHVLGGKLKKLLPKIIAPDALTTLEKELAQILVLVKRSASSALVEKELEELKKLLAEVKGKAANTQSKINGIELLTIIGQKERQL